MAEVDENEQMPILDNSIIKLTGSENNNNNTANNNTCNDGGNNNEIGNGSNVSLQQIIDMNMELVKTVQELVHRNRAASIKRAISQQEPMFFDGKDGDPVKLESWIRQFEKIFSAFGCPKEMRVDQAAFYLSENADAWWCNNMERLRKTEYDVGENGEEVLVPFTWDDFKRVLWAEFFPIHVRKEKWMEFNNLKQGTSSVHEYYLKFQELARIVPEIVPSTEEAKAWKFEENLNIEIKVRLGGEDFATLLAVYKRACNIERMLNENKALVGEKRMGGHFNNTGFPLVGEKRTVAHFNNTQGFRKKRNFNSTGNWQGDSVTDESV